MYRKFSAYSKTFQVLRRLFQNLMKKKTEIMCQNLFTGRILKTKRC